MSIVLQRLYAGGQIAAAGTTLFTASANVKTLITEWSFCNTDTSDHTVRVYIVRSGGSPGDANTFLPETTLAGGDSLPLQPGQTLYAGDFVRAVADADGFITCPNISGYTIPA